MNRATHIIKDVETLDRSRSVKVWRETSYTSTGLQTTFFVDMKVDGLLVLRQPYESLSEALVHYLNLVDSAYRLGYDLVHVES